MLCITLIPGVQESRSLARALLSRAMWRLGDEQRFEAWSDLMATHRLGRLMSRDSTVIGWLIGCTIEEQAIDAELRFLAETQSPAKLLKFYRRDLQKLSPRSSPIDQIDICERACALDACWQIARGKVRLSVCMEVFGEDSPLENQPLAKPLADATLAQSADWDEVMKIVNRWYDRVVADARLPTYRQREDAYRTLDRELKQLVQKRKDPVTWLAILGDKPALTQFTADLLIPSMVLPIANKHHVAARTAQKFQNLETAMALAAWLSDHGSYPKSLVELVPTYLANEPKDLFTDRTLKYERTADGYRCYSFGINEKDDDGRLHDGQPAGDDLVVQMPMPLPR